MLTRLRFDSTLSSSLNKIVNRTFTSMAIANMFYSLLFVLLLLRFPATEARASPGNSRNRYSEAPEYRNGLQCPVLERNSSSFFCTGNPSAIHVAMTIDSAYLRGSVASVHSIVKHSSCPENLFFHFVASESDNGSYSSTIRQVFPSLHFRLYAFDETRVADLISPSIRRALDTPLNYARSYLAGLLDECVERVIYLDPDTVVVDDIAKLWSISLSGSRAIGAPEYCHVRFSRYFTAEFWSDRQLNKVFDGKNACYFNTGVMVMDLAKWRERDFTGEIENWMKIQKDRRIYQLGSLPPFLLVFGGEIEAIDHQWNQHGLGGDNLVNSCRPLHTGPASLLHWSGKGKPWVRLDSGKPCPVDHLWAPYDLYRR